MAEPLHELGAFIRTQRERSALSVRKLAEQAGISNPYLSQIERGLRRPSADIVKALAGALSISAESLYQRAGWLAGDQPDDATVVDSIEADSRLTAGQRRALVEIYESFVRDNEKETKE
ncbi:MAG: helix-turn-helix transcriptional regulator [Acidimicrobiia bacterium]|nr:helix-turn-helix transcriptional regulator [Acidimicrobiia bacterium]MBT8251018.1 helix-turn-helix transcriptional regulator [Acidimicrobiia bacterium]NNC43711.1 helix-turn-helix transcriptional regulator [Acidimicrobiia bacterium]NND14637.1 helix-turn-helix transcriptional regulator [Acidimicrobiia bacterium]NNL29184.1 helix-turn-helix transcriptional regulator [Acidimicrobiia bacterium]